MHKIKDWFLSLNLGLRITVIVAGVAILGGIIVAPILIFSSTQEEVADNKNQIADKTTANNGSKEDNTSDSKDKAEENKSEENSASNEQNQNTTSSNSSNAQAKPSNTSNNQQNSVGSSATTPSQPTTAPANPDTPNQPSKPSTPTQPTTPTQPNPPAKTEAELMAERDQQRRNDMARMRSAVMNYQANNNGTLPGYAYQTDYYGNIIANNVNGQGGLVYTPSKNYTLPPANDSSLYASQFITRYMNTNNTENQFRDPDGWTYGLTIIHYDHYGNFSNKNAAHMVYLVHQAHCGTATSVLRTEIRRDYAILYKLENGNTYCIDNQ